MAVDQTNNKSIRIRGLVVPKNNPLNRIELPHIAMGSANVGEIFKAFSREQFPSHIDINQKEKLSQIFLSEPKSQIHTSHRHSSIIADKN
jgi:hypothetical protein